MHGVNKTTVSHCNRQQVHTIIIIIIKRRSRCLVHSKPTSKHGSAGYVPWATWYSWGVVVWPAMAGLSLLRPGDPRLRFRGKTVAGRSHPLCLQIVQNDTGNEVNLNGPIYPHRPPQSYQAVEQAMDSVLIHFKDSNLSRHLGGHCRWKSFLRQWLRQNR